MTHKMNQQAHKGAKFVKLHLLFCETFFKILNSKILDTVLVFFHCSGALVLVKKILGVYIRKMLPFSNKPAFKFY